MTEYKLMMMLLGIIVLILGVTLGITLEKKLYLEKENNNLKQESTYESTYDYKCFIPLEDGNYTIKDGILRTPSGRLIKCEAVK